MSQEKVRQADASGEPSCGQPMEGHLEALIQVVIMAGANFDCNGVYHALVEVAEIYRKVGGFKLYTAGNEYADSIAAGLAEGVARRQAQHAQQAHDHNDDHGHDPVIDADFVDQGSTYRKLSPAAKKRFN